MQQAVIGEIRMKIKNITILGGGLMGSGITQIFASRQCKVTIFDTLGQQCKALGNIQTNMLQMKKYDLCQDDDIENTINQISITDNIEKAIDGAELVIETIPENLALKQKIFAQLDQICPCSTILASGTSVISITEIAKYVKNKERVIGLHFWNPPFLIPLVEVIRTQWTADSVFERGYQIMKAFGKRPVRVNKDIPGFLVNRLQHALWREAIYLVEQGIADAKTVDEGIRYGFGLRLPILGPLENADMVGTDLTLAIHEYVFPYLNNSTQPSPLLKEKVAKGQLGFKSGEGFQQWSDDDITSSRERLLDYLLMGISGSNLK